MGCFSISVWFVQQLKIWKLNLWTELTVLKQSVVNIVNFKTWYWNNFNFWSIQFSHLLEGIVRFCSQQYFNFEIFVSLIVETQANSILSLVWSNMLSLILTFYSFSIKFFQGIHGTREIPESGVSLATRALARGTVYSVAGFSLFCFTVWKLMGVNNVSTF